MLWSLLIVASSGMATASADFRARDAARQRENTSARNDLYIPDIKEPNRREDCEADDCLWLRTYCADVFYNPFTPHQNKIIADCAEALRYGTQKCKAAPRGDGKTSIVKYLTLKYSLKRQVLFPLNLAATAEKAKKTLASLKRRLASRSDTPLAQDYPLECHVARYVDPWPSRARNVTANGRRPIHVEWGATWFIIPTWENEEPLGPILLSLGITSDELQGCNIYDRRPDFVTLDDLDSRDSLASEDGVVAEKIEEAVDKTVAGLGGQSRRLGQFMLCTITSRESAAFKYSDARLKPSWSGERIAAIIEWPEAKDRWQEYIELRQWGQNTFDDKGNPVDVFGRKAHSLYLSNRAEMDRVAILSNPHNFEADLLPDGSQKQVSALQRCYDYIADHGMASFLTEHQNDPPEEAGILASGITQKLIQKQVNGFARRVIPAGCTVLTHNCDVGKLKGFNWVVRAWTPDGTGHTIDYGVMNVIGAKYGSDEGLDVALCNAVLRRMDEFRTAGYATATGEIIRDSISTFDCRWKTDAVLAGVVKAGIGVHGIMGIGQSAGCVKGKFRDVITNSPTRRKCGTPGAYEELHSGPYGKVWVIHADADRWKGFEHDRWMSPKDKPGCMYLFGEPSDSPERLSADERAHEEYARQICAEIEVEEDHKRKWIEKGKENDYLDASWHSDVTAAMKGVRVLPAGVAKRAPSERPTAQQLAEKARKRA
jgi:hypothetical protein